MPTYTGTVTTPKSAPDAFDYMADVSHTSDWDPNCEAATKTTPGEVGVGMKFHLRFSGVAGQEMEFDYEVTEYDAPRRIVLEGGNDSQHSVDTIEVESTATGSNVTYTAERGARALRRARRGRSARRAGDPARTPRHPQTEGEHLMALRYEPAHV
ncbi:MAG: SRPBCC family protein [Solirubrobacteraceae bacterium]